jgi:hypothetical protein
MLLGHFRHEFATYTLRSFLSQSDEVLVTFLVETSDPFLVRPLSELFAAQTCS